VQPNPQQQMRNIMSRMEEKDKAGVPKEDFETARDIATDSIPGVSETKDIISLSGNIGKGDYVGAGIDATSLVLGAVPVVGDMARKGFKSLVAKDIKKATEFLKDTNLIDKWKKDNPNPKPQKRNPDVEKAANELLDGKITGKQYRSVVKENMPIRKINEVPEIPTFTEIVGSLTSDKSKKGILGLNKKIEDGTRVASRLDIPAYEKHDKWIVSVHDAKNKKGIEGLDGDIIGYGKTAVLKNVEFKSNPQAASRISAKRADKGTIARIFGDYVNADPDKVATSAKKFLKDPEWTQVGYNPFRHGFFYDKGTGLPVKSAKEVLQVGPLVLAKNAKKFTISEAKKLGVKGGLKIRTSSKSQVVFNEGGVTMKKQMELFEDGGLKEEGGMVDEVSGNDVPTGSTREEVRDDIPAQLSEGEFVFPADVVRFIGLSKLMQLRQEAKQGLKQMEAMGQMGNSDEATMPDDLPFDETDLDIEDDLEYNVGGYVPAQQGAYIAPQIPQQVGRQYGGQGTPYAPNMSRVPYTPYAPATSKQLLGPSAGGAPQTKSVRYFNAATGQTRMIPHILNPDGSIGNTLYPVPQGFVRQDEAPKEEAKTAVQSTKVAPVDAGDGGDPSDDGKGGASLSFGGTKSGAGKGLQSNAMTANISYNISTFGKAGVIGGLMSINDINQGKDVDTIGNKSGITTNPVEMSFGKGKVSLTSKQYAAVKNDPTGKAAKDLKERLEVLNSIVERPYTFNPTTNVYTDTLGNTLTTEQAEQAGKDVQDKISQEVSKGKDIADVIDDLTETEISVAQDYGITAEDEADTDDSQTTGGFDFGATQPGQDVTTSTGIGTDIDDDDDSYQDNNQDNNDSSNDGTDPGGYGVL
jgi:hypothetical protein